MHRVAAISLSLVAASAAASAAPTETVLRAFAINKTGDGALPTAAVIADVSGNLYTTTSAGGGTQCGVGIQGAPKGCGTIVELSPPTGKSSAWTETVLYAFPGTSGHSPNGAVPYASLVADQDGNLYTTTWAGGLYQNGTVIRLSPPAKVGGSWTEAVLYSFDPSSGDGYNPYASLLPDGRGGFFTTTEQGGASSEGAVVHLTPPAKGQAKWTEEVVHSFTGGADGGEPYTAVIADAEGRLYASTSYGGTKSCACGTIVRLTPPKDGGTAWTETTLYSFSGGVKGEVPGTLAMDQAGNLYTSTEGGVTGKACVGNGCGLVVELSPQDGNGAPWSLSILYAFQDGEDGSGPNSPLLLNASGSITLSTSGANSVNDASGNGTIDKLLPPANGGLKWTEQTLYTFKGTLKTTVAIRSPGF